jgi:hypothetical protein
MKNAKLKMETVAYGLFLTPLAKRFKSRLKDEVFFLFLFAHVKKADLK